MAVPVLTFRHFSERILTAELTSVAQFRMQLKRMVSPVTFVAGAQWGLYSTKTLGQDDDEFQEWVVGEQSVVVDENRQPRSCAVSITHFELRFCFGHLRANNQVEDDLAIQQRTARSVVEHRTQVRLLCVLTQECGGRLGQSSRIAAQGSQVFWSPARPRHCTRACRSPHRYLAVTDCSTFASMLPSRSIVEAVCALNSRYPSAFELTLPVLVQQTDLLVLMNRVSALYTRVLGLIGRDIQRQSDLERAMGRIAASE